jgi:hypothetical protein
MNILPALSDYLRQHIPECHWVSDRFLPNTMSSFTTIPYGPDAIKLRVSITQDDNLLQITNLDRNTTDEWTRNAIDRLKETRHLGNNNPEVLDLFDKHVLNKVLCIIQNWIAQQNPSYPGITSNRIDFT